MPSPYHILSIHTCWMDMSGSEYNQVCIAVQFKCGLRLSGFGIGHGPSSESHLLNSNIVRCIQVVVVQVSLHGIRSVNLVYLRFWSSCVSWKAVCTISTKKDP